MRFRLTATVLDSADPPALARFYQQLLGWPIGSEDPTWVTLRPPGGGPGLSFQLEPDHVSPVWPATPDTPQMQAHLDIEVDDLSGTTQTALAAGATLADFQPQDAVRVLRDPAGHPFCLWVRS
jgi:catechol 2,3-dioxygenase-like lactoylglutathione lyase family enzyme